MQSGHDLGRYVRGGGWLLHEEPQASEEVGWEGSSRYFAQCGPTMGVIDCDPNRR